MEEVCRRDRASLFQSVGGQVMRIAVLMTCYNRVDTTLKCLRLLFTQKLPDGYSLEVWLVDDASPDKTDERVKERFPQVNVVQGTGRLFWCKGMRLAWDKAVEAHDYDFYLWLNDDVRLKDDALLNLLNDYERVEGVIVGTFSSTENEADVSYGATRDLPDGCSPKVGICGINGNMVLVPKVVYDAVGPICGKYHHQYGDYDYGWQLRKKGLEFYSSSHFCGVCPQQPERYKHLAGKGLWQRIKLLWDPRGYDLHDAVLYKYRNWGITRALLSMVHIIWIVFKG